MRTGSSRGGRRQRRGQDVVNPLKVSLEDLYLGTTKKLSLTRNVICSKCKGLVFLKPFMLLFLSWYLLLANVEWRTELTIIGVNLGRVLNPEIR